MRIIIITFPLGDTWYKSLFLPIYFPHTTIVEYLKEQTLSIDYASTS